MADNDPVVEDWTDEQPETVKAEPRARRFDITEAQEKARRRLAYWTVLLLTLVIAAAFTAAVIGRWENVKDWAGLAFGAVIGLAGSATGFYFGKGSSGG